MEQNGSAINAGDTIPTQVCIIGSGPAAVTLAWYLLDQGIEVAIAEAGLQTGGNGDNRNSILYTGTSSGNFGKVEPDFLSRPSFKNQSDPWERECVYGLGFNGHHIGTTRMTSSASQGVVDKDLRLHELDNLYVAGSSVFPSAGLANPTFTITALSIRLAQHLGERLGRSLAGDLGDCLLKDSTVGA